MKINTIDDAILYLSEARKSKGNLEIFVNWCIRDDTGALAGADFEILDMAEGKPILGIQLMDPKTDEIKFE